MVERRNQTMFGMARSMMKAMGVLNWLWGEAVLTAVFILNRSPTCSVDDKTPYEAWYGTCPSVHFLRTFGCAAHVKVIGGHQAKLDDRSVPMAFIGYKLGSKAYWFYNPCTKRVCISQDDVLEEECPWDWSGEEHGDEAGGFGTFSVGSITMLGGHREERDGDALRDDTPTPSPWMQAVGGATPTPSPLALVSLSMHGSEPGAPRTPSVGPASTDREEPVTPLSGDPNLDIDCDDAPLRYQSLSSVLGHAGQLAEEAELLLVAR
jgi:hypothetical protein